MAHSESFEILPSWSPQSMQNDEIPETLNCPLMIQRGAQLSSKGRARNPFYSYINHAADFGKEASQAPELLDQRVVGKEGNVLHVVVGLVVPLHLLLGLPGKHSLENA